MSCQKASSRNQMELGTYHKIIPSDPSLLDDAVAGIKAAIDRTACWDEVEDVALAAREAVANAIVHGNHCNPAKPVDVSVAANANCDLLIVVRDSGSGFDPSKLPNPTARENLLANHGSGIFLIRQLMDEVDFKFATAPRFVWSEGSNGLINRPWPLCWKGYHSRARRAGARC